MPGFYTDYANNRRHDLVFGGAAFAPPATLYFGLSLAPASKLGAASEPSGGGYARVAVANNSGNFPAAAAGVKANAVVVTFPAPTGDWGTVVSLFVADAPAGGNVLAAGDLAAPVAVASGGPAPKVAAGALHLQDT
jgi:hypothetical protein